MESRQEIQFLGSFAYRRDGELLQPRLSRKTRAILAYLAISDFPHSRQSLYTLFAQESEDPQGTLRWHLSQIRRHLSTDILIVDNESVQFNHPLCYVDAFEFAEVLDHQSLEETSLDKLKQTLETYRGEFLLGDGLPDVPEFEMWLLAQRSRIEQCAERGLIRLVEGLIEAGELRSALEWVQRLLTLDPLLETAHAQLMWLYAKLGQRDAALRQYQACRDLLQRELAVEPSDQIQRMYKEIHDREVVRDQMTPPAKSIVFQLTPESTPFVGRNEELAQLNELWKSAQRKGSTIGLVEAEAGGGKSRLVEEFVKQQTNILFLSGRCYESGSRLPYQPWLDLLEKRLDQTSDDMLSHLAPVWQTALSRLLPTLRARLGGNFTSEDPVSVEERVMFIAVVEFLLKLPGTPATILFLDDLQWADEASLRLFQFVAHRVRDLEPTPPILLLGAFRTEEADDNPAVAGFIHDLHRTGSVMTLQLSPLDISVIDSLLAQLEPNTFPDGFDIHGFRDTIYQMTKGNPLYLSELVQELSSMTEVPETLPIPPSLEELVQRRLRQMPDSGRQVIEAMAVADMPTNFPVAQRISGRSEDEVFNAIDIGLRWRLLKDEVGDVPGMFNFSHDLMRETIRQQLNALRRQRLHQRSAVVLSDMNASAGKIAYHWHEAGDVEQELEYVIRAGDDAMELQSFKEARDFYSRASEIVKDKHQRASILINLGDVMLKLGAFDDSDVCYQEAYELAKELQDTELLADSQFGLGQVLQGASEWDRARGWFKKSLELYKDLQNDHKLAETYGIIGFTYHNEAKYSEAVEYYKEQYLTGSQSDDPAAMGIALVRLGSLYQRLNQNEMALNYFRDGLKLLQDSADMLNQAIALNNMAILYMRLDDYVMAEEYLRQTLAIDYDYDDMRGLASTTNNLGTLNWMLGHKDVSMAYWLYSLDLAIELKFPVRVAYSLANIVLYLNERGDFQLAQRVKEKAITLMEYVHTPHSHCQLLFEWAESLYDNGYYPEALKDNEKALKIAHEIERTDVIQKAEILNVQLRVVLQQLPVEDAVIELEELLKSCEEEKDQAEVHYVLWKLDGSRQTDRDAATGYYRALYDRSKLEEYRVHYKDLTGDELPPAPPAGPVLPFVTARKYDLPDLLKRVDDEAIGQA